MTLNERQAQANRQARIDEGANRSTQEGDVIQLMMITNRYTVRFWCYFTASLILFFPSSVLAKVTCKLEIISDKHLYNVKRSVEIRIDRRITKKSLEDIANKIKNSDPEHYDKTFILYYLPYQRVGAGAWATTHFNPSLQVEILGVSPDELQTLKAYSIKKGWQIPDSNPAPNLFSTQPEKLEYGGEILGEWIWDLCKAKITVFRKNGLYMLNTHFTSGGQSTVIMKAKNLKRGLLLKPTVPNPFGEHYIITKNGKLECYDEDHTLARNNITILPPEGIKK